MRVLRCVPAILLALFVSAAVADPQPPSKPLPHVQIVIDGDNGPVKFNVEIAGDWRSQEYGLMNRKSLPHDAGMLFDFHIPQMVSFWMKDTLIPLDMIFIKNDGTISSVAADAVPMSLTSIQSMEPIRAVLEINGGEAAELGIYPGQKVRADIFRNAVKSH